MKRLVFIIVLVFCFFISVKDIDASLITIDKNGNLIWKILAYETPLDVPQKNLEVTNVGNAGSANKLISLNRDGGKVSLKVGDEKELDVSNLGSDLIEIEERGDIKKIEIGLQNDKFSIKEGGIIALSSFPINIDPVESRLSIVTSTGKKYLGIFPYEAVQVALRSKYISKINSVFDITEEDKDISYAITGEKVINLFNIVKIGIPVTAKVSASTGEILFVDQPIWLKFIGFMFS